MEDFDKYDSFFVDIYRCWNTCKKMVEDRGYKISLEIKNSKVNEFYKLYQNEDAPDKFNNYDILGTNESGQNLLVKYLIDPNTNFKAGDVNASRMDINEKYGEDTRVIFVMRKQPKSTNLILDPKSEFFIYTELIINRTEHRLVPKHILLTDAEKKELLTTYECKDSQLPRMLKTDFVARYFGAKAGDIFRIIRPSPSAGFYVSYRVVK